MNQQFTRSKNIEKTQETTHMPTFKSPRTIIDKYNDEKDRKQRLARILEVIKNSQDSVGTRQTSKQRRTIRLRRHTHVKVKTTEDIRARRGNNVINDNITS